MTAAENRETQLAQYADLKLEVAEIVRALMHAARELGDELQSRQAQQALAKLAEDRFNLVVAGQFNRGKSTLMNAVLGRDRLPTGILPLTSVITTVSYGSRDKVLLRRDDSSFPKEIAIDELRRYVTEEGNPGNEKGIVEAHVEMRAEILRLGFYFIDTPGIGSAIAANSRTTQSFLPEADAVVLVTSADAALSGAEVDFIAQLGQHVRRVFFVVNKIDLLPEQDREPVLSFIRDRIRKLGFDEPQVFALSARDALRARMANDTTLLASTGLPELEAALIRFLTIEKNREFLAQMCRRTHSLLERVSLTREIAQRATGDADSRQKLLDSLERQIDKLFDNRRRLTEVLLAKIASGFPAVCDRELGDIVQALASEALSEAESRLSTSTLADIVRVKRELNASFQRMSVERTRLELEQRVGKLASELNRFGQAEIDEMRSLPERVADIDAYLLTATELEDTASVTLRLGMAMPAFKSDDVRPIEVPWWFYAAAALRLRRVLMRFWTNASARALASLRGAIFDRVLLAAEDSVERFVAEVDHIIRSEEERIRGQLQRTEMPRESVRLEEVRDRLHAFESRLAGGDTPSRGIADQAQPNATSFAAGSCVICGRIRRVLANFVSAYQYELAVSRATQEKHLEAGGFCPLHTWEYASIASPQGISVAYAPLIRNAGDELLRLAATLSGNFRPPSELAVLVRRLVPTSDACRACRVIGSEERAAVRAMTLQASDSAVPPLCMLHLSCVLEETSDSDQAQRWAEAVGSTFQRLSEDMRMYALKHDAIRRELMTEEERQAYLRALERLAGSRFLSLPWVTSAEEMRV